MRVRWLPLSVFLAMILASVLGPEPGLSAEFACDRSSASIQPQLRWEGLLSLLS
jgi:hypothetical protein